jgi:hypothetical protein
MRAAVLASVCAFLALCGVPSLAEGEPTISAAVTPAELTIGKTLTVSGEIAETGLPSAGSPLVLQASSYPYSTFETVSHTMATADGSYSFAAVGLEENTRLRVVLEGATNVSSPTIAITVDPLVAINSSSLGPGRVRLSIRIHHTSTHGFAPTSAHWYVAARGSDVFRPSTETPTREISPGVTYASAIVDPPSRHFLYRVCLNPSWEATMGSPSSHGACPNHAFRLPVARAHAALEYGGEGHGRPLAPFPSRAAIAAAASYLQGRTGRTSFAVLDSSRELGGLRTREHFQTASVIKVMMLVAYLQMLEAHHRPLQASDRALLYPMIHESNNDDASAVLDRVGESAVERVAHEAGMEDYRPGIGWWAYSQTSAADQARFFAQLERLTPRRFYPYERGLMATIEPEQSWGIPPVARPRWQVFFKTGALPSEGLFNEVARLERGDVSFTVAVLTDGDPSMAYGEQTIEGVGAILLANSR